MKYISDLKDQNLSSNINLNFALILVAISQLMLVLDDAIANIALPSIQNDFYISAVTLPWIINAYLLAFGSLLLLGGRLGDIFGRRRILRLGMLIFVVGSLLCGLATNTETLITARTIQGIGAALTAPNILALITIIFPEGQARNKAMAIYGAMSALGIVGGVIIGGILTGVLGWRSIFLINVPIGIFILIFSRKLPQGECHKTNIDVVSAITATLATFLFTYAFTRVGEVGWDIWVVTSLFISFALTYCFIKLQKNRVVPMLPLDLFHNRNRACGYILMLFTGVGLMGTFYLIALFMQKVLLLDAIRAGLAALPFGLGIIAGSIISSKMIEKIQPKILLLLASIIATIGLFCLSTIDAASSYFLLILPALFMVTLGLGILAITLSIIVVQGVSEKQVSIASAMLNSSQQTGAAFGLAILTSIATYTSCQLTMDTQTKLAYGYSEAFFYIAIFMVVATLIIIAFFRKVIR